MINSYIKCLEESQKLDRFQENDFGKILFSKKGWKDFFQPNESHLIHKSPLRILGHFPEVKMKPSRSHTHQYRFVRPKNLRYSHAVGRVSRVFFYFLEIVLQPKSLKFINVSDLWKLHPGKFTFGDYSENKRDKWL